MFNETLRVVPEIVAQDTLVERLGLAVSDVSVLSPDDHTFLPFRFALAEIVVEPPSLGKSVFPRVRYSIYHAPQES